MPNSEHRSTGLLIFILGAATGDVIGGALLVLYWPSLEEFGAEWTAAIATFAAVVVAIFGPMVQAKWDGKKTRTQRLEAQQDLARALYVELVEQVARCCYDYEFPWKGIREGDDRLMTKVDLLKFAPMPPIIFPNTADRLASFPGVIPGAVLRFYYRTAALRRDLESIAEDASIANANLQQNAADRVGNARASKASMALLALRFKQTLLPGSIALDSLRDLVPDADAIEAAAIKSHDDTMISVLLHPTEKSLRQRLKALVNE